MVKWEGYIVSDDGVLSGKTIIKGTRFSIEFIMDRLANGWTESEIIENYPSLNKDPLKAVNAYTESK